MTHPPTLILTHSQVSRLMPHARFNAMIEAVFREWGNGNVVMPPKLKVSGLVLGILSVIFWPLWWIFDLVTVIAFGKIGWFE